MRANTSIRSSFSGNIPTSRKSFVSSWTTSKRLIASSRVFRHCATRPLTNLTPVPIEAAAHDVAQDEVPERLGRYMIERQLGQGGFGTVYLAVDPQLNRQVALKVPRRSRRNTPKAIQTLINEARAAAQLDHPGIVTIYDVVQEDDRVFVVQQYVPGTDLSSRTGTATTEPRPAAQLLAEWPRPPPTPTSVGSCIGISNQRTS